MQASAEVFGKAVALGPFEQTAELDGGGEQTMKRRIEQMRKRLAEQRRLWRHNQTQRQSTDEARTIERFAFKALMTSDMPATH